MTYTLIHGDALEVLPTLEAGSKKRALIIDPPYGINANGQTLGLAGHKYKRDDREWDSGIVDLSFYTAFDYVCVWGGNYYTNQLPPTNQWLVWDKKNYSRSFSEVEMAWTNYAPQSRILHHHWGKEKEFHPTQKPLRVMRWCLSFLPDVCTVYDLFMGSGTIGVAALSLGFDFVGIEINDYWFSVAQQRIKNAAGDFTLTEREKQSGQMPLWGDE